MSVDEAGSFSLRVDWKNCVPRTMAYVVSKIRAHGFVVLPSVTAIVFVSRFFFSKK